jgi:hypothetical protein
MAVDGINGEGNRDGDEGKGGILLGRRVDLAAPRPAFCCARTRVTGSRAKVSLIPTQRNRWSQCFSIFRTNIWPEKELIPLNIQPYMIFCFYLERISYVYFQKKKYK